VPIVTFTTDFGSRDGYAGAMKGVVLSLAPNAILVDISHGVPPQDVAAGAVALTQEAALDAERGSIVRVGVGA
jgi:S-adenosylmethionine hydrolase